MVEYLSKPGLIYLWGKLNVHRLQFTFSYNKQ